MSIIPLKKPFNGFVFSLVAALWIGAVLGSYYFYQAAYYTEKLGIFSVFITRFIR